MCYNEPIREYFKKALEDYEIHDLHLVTQSAESPNLGIAI